VKDDEFKRLVWEKGRQLYRDMPWRQDTRPYYILVSELMLQQTQVERVIPKFQAFIAAFPTITVLAKATLADVLKLWSGLGYNRRAKYLHDAAKKVVANFDGTFPATKEALLELPGVGEGTAGAILTYAFNQPVVFVETNVRTVYFHHFFPDGDKVRDSELKVLVARTLGTEHPHEFYWALMDYGAWLKKNGVGNIKQSYHYKKQSVLRGSVREMRGQLVRLLGESDKEIDTLAKEMLDDVRFKPALEGLIHDGLVKRTHGRLHLTK
jgi:A/G-specific adenine glycosylase